MESFEKDIKVRKAAAWRVCGKIHKIWKSTLPRKFKHRLFAATVESVLLYGCETWTITPRLPKDLDGCYTRLLRTAFNVHWKRHMTNQQLYGDLPKITDKTRERRLCFAGLFFFFFFFFDFLFYLGVHSSVITCSPMKHRAGMYRTV